LVVFIVMETLISGLEYPKHFADALTASAVFLDYDRTHYWTEYPRASMHAENALLNVSSCC